MSQPLWVRPIVGLQKGIRSAANTLYPYRRFALSGISVGVSMYLTKDYLFELSPSSGSSMFPTIPDRTNYLFVNKTYANGRGLKIGDCVQVQSPIFKRQYLGKRVIGLPGDYVLRSRHGSPTPGETPVSGVTDWRERFDVQRKVAEQGLTEEQIMEIREKSEHEQLENWEEPEMIQVPEGHVWLEGDNLSWSRDSRFYGPVPMALIKGRSSWFVEGFFSFTSLNPGRGLRKVEASEMKSVLGE